MICHLKLGSNRDAITAANKVGGPTAVVRCLSVSPQRCAGALPVT